MALIERDEAVAGKPVAASCRCGAVCAGFPGVARPDCLGWVAVRAGGRRPARLPMLLVACGPTGVPGAVGSGRPRDRHTRAFGSESSISKPGQALRTLRHPPHRWGFSLLCTSHPGPAAHGHRRQALQPGLSRPAGHASPSTPAAPGVLVVIGVVLKPGQAPLLLPGTAVVHQPGAVCPALVSNLARSGVCSMRT